MHWYDYYMVALLCGDYMVDMVACGAARYAGGGVRMSNGFGVLLSQSLCNRPMVSQFGSQGSVADGMQPHQFPAVPPGLTTPRLLSLRLPL